jgi:hypothetical protein
MTGEEIEEHKKKIDQMSREQLCRLWRFAPSGHPYFVSGTELQEYFDKRFRESGGFTPQISKKIGW